MTKLIKKSQLKGLMASSSTRRDDTRKLIEAACEAVSGTKRPSVDSVHLQGGGAFGRSAVKDRDRHRDILDKWQAKWDREHPATDTDGEASISIDPGKDRGSVDEATAHASAAVASSSPRSSDVKAELVRVKEQLHLAREAVDDADRRHRMDRAEIEDLKLKLQRARAEPRRRLPKRFADEPEDKSTASGVAPTPAAAEIPIATAPAWGTPTITYRLEGRWNA